LLLLVMLPGGHHLLRYLDQPPGGHINQSTVL